MSGSKHLWSKCPVADVAACVFVFVLVIGFIGAISWTVMDVCLKQQIKAQDEYISRINDRVTDLRSELFTEVCDQTGNGWFATCIDEPKFELRKVTKKP